MEGDSHDDAQPPAKKRHEMVPMTFKFLANRAMAATLRQHAVSIGAVAQGSLHITEGADYYPGTSSYVASVEAIDPVAMASAVRQVTTMAVESGACVVDHGRELRFTCLMPSKSVSALIGVAGANVQQLQKATGAHIHVDSTALGFGPAGDRVVHVHGAAQSIEQAVERVIHVLKDFTDQPWYGKWAERTNEDRLDALEAPPLPSQETQLGGGRGGADASMTGGPGGTGGGDMMAGMMGGMLGGPMAMGMMNPMAMMMGGMMNPMGGMPSDPMSAMLAGGRAPADDPSPENLGPGASLVMQAVQELPPDIAADPRGFLLRCAVPGRLVSALLGQEGEGIKEVQEFTDTQIDIPGSAHEPTRIMHIEGQLLNVCAAYMLMMVRYINVEEGSQGLPPPTLEGPGGTPLQMGFG